MSACLSWNKKRRFLPAKDVNSHELGGNRHCPRHGRRGHPKEILKGAALLIPTDKKWLVFNLKYFEDMNYEQMSENK